MTPAAHGARPEVDAVDALLPQTQCRACGFPDCRRYAQAIVDRGVAINRCPPGGVHTVTRLARLTGQPVRPVDPACGVPGPRLRARVDEAWCIGCTLCIKACPVDAIIGTARHMHAVVTAWCTGCALCVAPCPVDCIVLEPAEDGPADDDRSLLAQRAAAARERYRARTERLARRQGARTSARQRAREADARRRRARIAEAVARVRAARAGAAPSGHKPRP